MAVTLAGAQRASPFKLTIRALENPIPAGSKLEISVVLTNLSDATVITPPIPIVDRRGDDGDWLYRIYVTGPEGKPVANARLPPKITGGDAPQWIWPRVDFLTWVLVTRLFDITRQGNYSIKACTNWPGTAVGVICSNTITVTVRPPLR